MKRYGVAFTPRMRGLLGTYFARHSGQIGAGDAAGIPQERPKTIERKLSYEK